MSEAALHEAAPLSVNAAAARAVERLKADAAKLKIAVARGSLGETLIDAGHEARGSIAAGLRLAEICMGGLGTIDIVTSAATPRWPWTLTVRSSLTILTVCGSTTSARLRKTVPPAASTPFS